MGMRSTCIICTLNLIILAICGGVYAFSGVNVLPYLFFKSAVATRSFLAITFVSALFIIYVLIVIRPYKGLK